MSNAGTVLLSVVVSLIGSGGLVTWLMFNRETKREHRVWLRDRREESFINVMVAAQVASLAAFRGRNDEDALSGFTHTLIPAQVYAPSEVALKALEDIRLALADMHTEPRGNRNQEAVRNAMRRYDSEVRRALDINREGESDSQMTTT